MTSRLGPQPGEIIDRTRALTFRWEGAAYPAYPGDTIVSALAACGVRVFARSPKYHRPRGILTASYFDPNCLVQVGGEPNVRGAHRRVEDGMNVRPQNVWPCLRLDIKSANQWVGRFISAGFYYKTFMKPRRLWPFYESVLRRFAAGGHVSPNSASDYFDKRYAHPEVLIAGGGPAGMAAAIAAAEAGAQVMLVEEEHEQGGHLRWGGDAAQGILRELRAAVATQPAIEVLTNSIVTGRYDHNWVAVLQRGLPGVTERLIKARAGTLIVAPGLIERPYVFEGNDLPGVMLSTAVRRLINLYAVRPGARAVVFSANADGDAAAADLERIGVQLAAVVDARRGEDLVRAIGRKSLRAVEVDGKRIDCDLLVLATGWTAPTLLLNMAGDRPRYDSRAARFFPGDGLPDDVMTTGGLAGDGNIEQLVAHAQATGKAAAARAGHGLRPTIPKLPVSQHPQLFRGSTHGFVDLSEDITSSDILSAAREGYDSIELVKRYTTATMGSAQGKLETVNTVALLAEALEQDIAETGTTTWRPPYAPITLGALGGRKFEPVQVSPMQSWHEAHGAVPMIAGRWIRPAHYGDPEAEVRNTRTNIGLIDVTPLGKFDLRGPDVPQLLDLLYVNRWSQLPTGAVRYGVMCAEDGVVLDDGVTGRLGSEHYWMTTTSSGAAEILEWIEAWIQDRRLRVHVTPVTSNFASVNVAGPRSRDLVSRVAEGVDVAPTAFRYMQVRTGRLAGVDDCILWRIGFTGELSYELHVPAGYGLYLWETLMEVGKNLGVKPFGVETQRILRLEKGHIIVGQDTDGLTQAFSAGLDGVVKLDKEDFAGRAELAWQLARGDYARLVGLQPLNRGAVPPEGCQIVEGSNQIIGRVTSSQMSPTLKRAVCLALVEPYFAKTGTVLKVQLPDGRRIEARVMGQRAHFDPHGIRLHA